MCLIYLGEFRNFSFSFFKFRADSSLCSAHSRLKEGLRLWGCSTDGLAAVVSFSLSEFPSLVPETARRMILSGHGFTPRFLASTPRNLSAQNSFVAAGSGTTAQPNKLVARKGPGAKRPRLQSQVVSTRPQVVNAQPSNFASVFASAPVLIGPITNGPITNGNAFTSTSSNAFASTSSAPYPPQNAYNGAAPHPPTFNHDSPSLDQSVSRKRKASPIPFDELNVHSAVVP